MLTFYAVTFQVKFFGLTGITLPTPIIQITLFTRPPKLPPSHTEKSQEKIKFLHSHPKNIVGEIVSRILKTATPLSSTFSTNYKLFLTILSRHIEKSAPYWRNAKYHADYTHSL